jgi:hypothetical protein
MSFWVVPTNQDDEETSGTSMRLPRLTASGHSNDALSRPCEAGGASRSNLEDCQASLRMGIYAKNAVTQLSK